MKEEHQPIIISGYWVIVWSGVTEDSDFSLDQFYVIVKFLAIKSFLYNGNKQTKNNRIIDPKWLVK